MSVLEPRAYCGRFLRMVDRILDLEPGGSGKTLAAAPILSADGPLESVVCI